MASPLRVLLKLVQNAEEEDDKNIDSSRYTKSWREISRTLNIKTAWDTQNRCFSFLSSALERMVTSNFPEL